MSTSSQPSENTHVSNNIEPLPTLLPRSAWDSQIAYLRVLFRAKKALDRIEQAASLKNLN